MLNSNKKWFLDGSVDDSKSAVQIPQQTFWKASLLVRLNAALYLRVILDNDHPSVPHYHHWLLNNMITATKSNTQNLLNFDYVKLNSKLTIH